MIAEDVLAARLSGRLVCPKCGEPYHVTSRPPKVAGVCDHDGTPLFEGRTMSRAIRHRFEVYHSRTSPLRDYYSAQGIYLAVNAEGTAEEVFERFRLAIEGRKSESAG